MSLSLLLRRASTARLPRHLHTSSILSAAKDQSSLSENKAGSGPAARNKTDTGPLGVDAFSVEQLEDLLEDEFDDDDTTSSGHLMLEDQREVLHYMRLIEHELPRLVAYRKPFNPPTDESPLVIRSIDYGGEQHPISNKRVAVVAVDQLPLRDEQAIHKVKLLAGSRWSIRPPSDSGACGSLPWGNGFIKISCEDFPKPEQNLKWIDETLGRLVTEANDTATKYRDVPLDFRHIYSKAQKAKRGEHLKSRIYNRPTVYDFPEEWLPQASDLRNRKAVMY